eukprot:8851356-Lingulodinium_polyedra.AAC.1
MAGHARPQDANAHAREMAEHARWEKYAMNTKRKIMSLTNQNARALAGYIKTRLTWLGNRKRGDALA